MTRDATVLSCFSGIGGLDLGLERVGFRTLACLEVDEAARAILRAHRPDWRQPEPRDVVEAGRQLRPSNLGVDVGDLTLLAGGPPCQPFSKAAQWAGPKEGIRDLRALAIHGMLDLVDGFLPQALLIENVAGFLQGSRSAKPLLDERLARVNARHGTNYRLQHWILDAASYGVPQHRRRAIAVAFRDDQAHTSAAPLPTTPIPLTAWDAIEALPRPRPAPQPVGRYADLLPCIPEGGNYQYLTSRGGGSAVELFGYRTRYWSFLLKLARDRPAWTLAASPGPSTGPFHWDNRPLTVAERCALQGLPPTWLESAEARAAVRLSGNATPPPLAAAVGNFVRERLGLPVLPPVNLSRSARPVPRPRRPAALPDRWVPLVRTRASHPGPGLGPGGAPSEARQQ